MIWKLRSTFQWGIEEKLNNGLSSVKEIFAGLGYTRPHTIAATSAAIKNIEFKMFHALSTAKIWHRLTSGCMKFLRNISKEFISHVMNKFKLLQENDSRTAWRILLWQVWNSFSSGSVVSNEENIWKSEVQKQSTHS